MSNRISVNDDSLTGIKRIMKAKGYESINDAADAVIHTGLSRLKALKAYAEKQSDGKETKSRKPKGSGKKKKAKKEKLEVASEKPKKSKKAAANGEAKPKKKKKKEPSAPKGETVEVVEELQFN